MKPIKFPGANVGMGELQPQFITLPMLVRPIIEQPGHNLPIMEQPQPNGSVQYLFKYELSDFDIEQIVRTRAAWFSQFGNCFHPVLPQIENPFNHFVIEYEETEHPGRFNVWVPLNNGEFLTFERETAANVISLILMQYPETPVDRMRFEEKQKSVVDADGNLKL